MMSTKAAQMSPRNFWNVPVMRQPDNNCGNLLKKLKNIIEDKYHTKIGDYWDFHKWSVENIVEFWSELWDFAGIVYSERFNKVIDPDASMDGPKEWFQGAKLNFAENLLKYRDDSIALIVAGEERESEEVTYAQMYEEVKLYSAAFRKLGLKKGDVVVCYMSNRKEAIFAMQAVVSIGAIWAGALPLLGSQAVLNRFKQVNPKVLLTIDRFMYQGEEQEMLHKVKEVSEGLPTLEKVIIVPTKRESLLKDIGGVRNSCFLEEFLKLGLEEGGSVHPLTFEQVSFSHPVFINYTSGTTGLPKAVVHGCGGLLSMARDFSLHLDTTRGSIWLSVSSVGWVTWNMVITLLSQGFTLLLFEGAPYFLTPTFFWDLIDEYKITNIFMPASIIDEYHKRGYLPTKNHHLTSLKVMLLGGSVVKAQIFDFIYQKVKQNVMFCPSYGSTELMGSCLILETTLPVYQGETNAVSLGDNLEILDKTGNSFFEIQSGYCKPVYGEVGELVISKPVPNLFVGLWNDPDGSKCRKAYFSAYPGKFAMGDYGIINPKTNGISICCRSDETLKQRGCRFGSAEIYNVVDTFAEVRDSLCVSHYSRDMDERAVLFLKIREDYSYSDDLVKKIREAIARELTVRHVPDVIIETQDIPISMNGKKMEIIVKKIINKMPYNTETIINPESLKNFYNVPELQGF